MYSNSLIELDRAHLIHPVASYRGHEKLGVRVLASAKGATVTDASGKQLIDGFAGLWCVNAGYGHESIVEAAARQMRELPYATAYFGLGSEPAIRLAGELADRAPGDLNHVYFTLGGSDAVDSTIRFIRYYWNARGKPERDQFISVEQGYHGSSTVGAGLTALPAFHAGFGVPFDWQHKIPSHYAYRNPAGDNPQAIIDASLAALKSKVEAIGPERVAAFYVEPIQGSGGVLVPPTGWMKAMREFCRAHDILFVADEVITGFGRTGPLFACSEDEVVPDFMTTAKGLTSGYVPMGAVFMADHVYETIAEGAGAAAVGHGYTYSAHPVSAAVGLEVLRLYENGLLENGVRAGARLMQGLESLRDHPLVGDVRGRGMLAAVELVVDKVNKTPLPASAEPARRIFDRAWENGLVIRAFGNGVLGYAPPLCCTETEIDAIVERTRITLDETLEDPDVRRALRA
ncbi:aminotransferase class III-fold pyridoxal phosphate-dependent enzyme (plasmid) [Rhizobium leguminosarum]|jgi:adenosylmethionine-8-amino-7-oxononanoate aminotransferase|uniref:Aminotransferase class III-fold pyridoxal phosphate-dependent enzyme n=1 Tax=Rhizobium leguminosarum TaxID=384 RepID=A0A444ILA9_RHILE|nr:aspartate aminotransferase family protein [Rhizobium leguminosarum]MDH6660439.1 putrescine aminotransferase [Rhizobium sophorae]ASS58376.1 aspartate aminotransferase family protein [Rhizobium leguminosarum bv. viciae]AVC47254.1 aminotransferase class-III family protein [Rhizobium leguminosarum bv. viciae]MBB4329620.1 adenosylmethionine-8-amino-7-oxononanoate aminotransferase [Rhizobium leguminosarum]MBB4342536.1 adenosylmethionine-8-amino-7-oxononanoate aminotransferase [Rhizobium leguminos